MSGAKRTIEPFKIRLRGLSQDGRTNAWSVTCGCGKMFSPRCTMMATDTIACPKCGYEETVNYNDLLED